MVLINSEKGNSAINQILNQFDYFEPEEGKYLQYSLENIFKIYFDRKKLWKLYKRFGFGFIKLFYGHEPYKKRFIRKFKKLLGK